MPEEEQERLASFEARLDRLQAVTDIALTDLDLDDMLDKVLDRVLDVLGVDTAAVLLLDESGRELVARAARGIEEEVRQGVRIPWGHRFAGRIAAERRPVLLDRVDETTVANPILWEKGIKAMLGVPLINSGTVMGVLHVGRLSEGVFSKEDGDLLQIAGDRITAGLRLWILEAERDAAEALQRSLLPSAPRRLGDLEFSARYVPTERGGVGGDWYDVFTLENGDVWVVMGDVAGHGLRAAVVMGRIRSALRAYALLGSGPDEVLAMTDRKVQHFEVGTIATVAAAVISPPYDEMRVALAGHPAPVIAHAGVEAEILPLEPGLPLGIGIDAERPLASVPLDPGSVAVFYTDGLIERRGEDIRDGLELLRASVPCAAPADVCREVMVALVGNYEPDDDVAMLAMRRALD